MKQDIQVIRDSIGKIVSMLTSRAIKVTQRGVKAYVAYDAKSGAIKVVNVPYLPDDATPEFIAAVQGFLDHEVGHVLFTDQKVVIAANKMGAKIANLANIVEDVFIERKMTEAFRGSSHNLEQVRKFYLERICGKGITEALAAGDQMKAEGYAFVAAFRAWGGQTSAQDFIKQPHVAQLVEPLKAKLGDDILRKLTRTMNSKDCLDLAIEVQKALTPPPPVAPPPPPPPKPATPPPVAPPPPSDEDEDDDQDNQDDGPGASGDQAEDGDAEGDTSTPPAADEEDDQPGQDEDPSMAPANGSEEQDAEPEDDDAQGDPSQGGASAPSDPAELADDGQDDAGDDDTTPANAPGDSDAEDDGSAGLAGEGDEQTPAAEGEQGDDNDDGPGTNGDAESGQSQEQDDARTQDGTSTPSKDHEGGSDEDADATQKDPERDLSEIFEEKRDFDDAISEGLTREAEHQFNSASYQIYSTEWDRVTNAREAADAKAIASLDHGTEGTLGVMQKQLERAIAAKARKSWNPAQRRGRIAPGSLFKSAVGDDRLFRQRFETQAKNTAFTLLVDNSGSMVYTGNLVVAAKASYALSQVLERIKVVHEVIGFTTYESKEMERAMRDDLTGTVTPDDYARDEAIYMPIFKGFGERLGTQVKARFASMISMPDFCRCNIDGESIQIAAHRLKSQRAERHIMCVLSDGDPNCSPGGSANINQLRNHTREAVKKAQAAGIEVVGIGIRTNAVKSYYDKHIVLNDLAELPSVVMGQLTKLLLA